MKSEIRCTHWRLARFAVSAACAFAMASAGPLAMAKPLGQAVVTELNNDVRYKASQANERVAKVQDVVRGSDLVGRGMRSQAELQFQDNTITRLGSSSLFSFDPEKRRFELKSGVLLFDMPKGAGGGRIVTPCGTAAIEGTAGIVSNHANLKVICLAGVIRLLNAQGRMLALLQPGQMYIQGLTRRAVDVNLSRLGTGKLLRNGLPNNQGEHNDAKKKQLEMLLAGKLAETPFVMFGEGTDMFMMPGFPAGGTAAAEEYQRRILQETRDIMSGLLDRTKKPVVVTTGDVVDSSQAKISSGSGTVKSTGTIGAATGAANFTAPYISLSGQPTLLGPVEGDFQAIFSTLGTISINDFSASEGSTLASGFKMAFFGGSSTSLINVDSSTLGAQSYGDGGKLLFRSLGDIVVGGASTLEASGYNDRGFISLDANGSTVFMGDDAGSMSIARARGYGGQSTSTEQFGVEMISRGTADQMGVLLQDAVIDVNSTYTGESIVGPAGGEVLLNARRQVTLLDTTDIQANGPSAGGIKLIASGTPTTLGQVTMQTVGDGYIRLSAQDGATVLSAITDPRVIEITGVQQGSSTSIKIWTTGRTARNGDYAGGNITVGNLSGLETESLSVRNAQFVAASTGSLPGGNVKLTAKNIFLDNILIDVSSLTGYGRGGTISVLSRNTGGTITINDCTFRAAGAAGSATDAITIRGYNVVFTGDNVFDVGANRNVVVRRTTGSGLPRITSGQLVTGAY